MNTKHIRIKSVRDYLLGTLTEDDAALIEEQYFANPHFFEEVRIVERVLIEEYLDDSLDSREFRR